MDPERGHEGGGGVNIQSATKKAAEIGGVIYRRSWGQCTGDPVVIIPGYGPECCQMAHLTADGLKDKAPRWQPQQDDLVADDWMAVRNLKELEAAQRVPFTPMPGKIYHNRGGGEFRCLKCLGPLHHAVMQNTASGWVLNAHGCGIYPDETIDWDYSSGGHFPGKDGEVGS